MKKTATKTGKTSVTFELPAEIRRILTMSAKRLGPGERDDNFGSGLIDPLQALQLADPRTATTTPPRRR